MSIVRYLDSKRIMLGIFLIYKLLLDYIYKTLTSKIYAYSGFISEGNDNDFIISWLLFFCVTIIMVKLWDRINEFSVSLILILYLIRFVPTTTIIANIPQPVSFIYKISLFWILLFTLVYLLKLPGIKPIEQKRKARFDLISLTMVLLSLVVIYVSGVYAHFRINFNLLEVYEFRDEARGFNVPLFLVYIWGAAAYVLPVLFVYYLVNKKVLICCFLAFTILLNFSIDGSKTVIFSLILFVLLHFLYSDYLIKFFPLLLIFTFTIAILEEILFETNFIHYVLVRRMFFIPAYLDTLYYDFLTNHSYMLSGTKTPIQFLIGDFYFDKEEMRANNGMFSDSIVNFGSYGFLIFPVIFAIYTNVCNKSFKYAGKELLMSAAIIFAITLQSSAFTTALATHGLFLLSFIIYLISSGNLYKLKGKYHLISNNKI